MYYCPKCKKEYTDGSFICGECKKRLVTRLPAQRQRKIIPTEQLVVESKRRVSKKTIIHFSFPMFSSRIFLSRDEILELGGKSLKYLRIIGYFMTFVFVITLILSLFTYTYVKEDGIYERTIISNGERYYQWTDFEKAKMSTYRGFRSSTDLLSFIGRLKNGDSIVFRGNDLYLSGKTFIILDRLMRENNIDYTISTKAERILEKNK